ncbi:pyrroloquinoline quinone biosynthesis protein PqqB [Hymenobacter ginsengisoli]|uniref:Pyrroloquinoline quinone biosynthesis protein PqqB n=1 Tax=Hymenobacter ginsengisoli TaxID=1051626 RepID=A0ABP8Q4T5_9BACT|nr:MULTISPECIES: MBL fold metallo-hydrolase [unclassified Hymenobacter]MBO2032499.1 pyrroloquinoline quinone biosynthesis protein PqqB [Hymenobacter sp. BT559]
MKKLFLLGLFLTCGTVAFAQDQKLIVLGVAQDGGYPQIGAVQEFAAVELGQRPRQKVVSLGVVDEQAGQKFLFEATPDMSEQLYALNEYLPTPGTLPTGIFLTHGHIGHYTGLMYLGREALGASQVPVYAMPRMVGFLTNNAPWSQLVTLQNIQLKPLASGQVISLNPRLKITPFLVPHRDEFTETVGFELAGAHKKAVFIPDIDKWAKWPQQLSELLKRVDYALLDATFYRDGEIARPMAEVPHPFVEETLRLLQSLPPAERAKVYFIHFNHTNPLLQRDSPERRAVLRQGFHIADEGLALPL